MHPNTPSSYQTDDSVYFFSNELDPLNPFSAHRVKLWGKTFATAEHGYQYRKFSETAPEVAAEIIEAPSPWAAIQIERAHRNLRRKDWEEAKAGIMRELLAAKAEQNDDVKACLVATGTKAIKKNSPKDDYWGIGADGRGKNVMGEILMEIRAGLVS